MTSPLLPSVLAGLACGARSLVPLALVRGTAGVTGLEQPEWPRRTGGQVLLGLLAAGELLGDKHPSAPDRTQPGALTARAVTGALSGAALAVRGQRRAGAGLGATAALLSASLTLRGRQAVSRRLGRTSAALLEDALVLGLTATAIGLARRQK
jgi:uncharacterized membrane protein